MSRISNELATQIAFKLTEKSRIAADALHVQYRELVTVIYESQTPDEVTICLKKYPDWISTIGGIKLNGHGFNWEYISATRHIICNNGSNSSGILKMTDKNSKQIMEAKRKWDKAKEKYENLKSESKQALLALKTFNNIRKELPQAAPMLPPPMSNALVCNFTSLKSKLNNQPEVLLQTQTS